MSIPFPIFMGEVPEYRIKSGLMHIVWPDLELVMPVNKMLAGIGGAKREIDKWQREAGEVVPFRCGGHAASS